jgi:hypothetical protein
VKTPYSLASTASVMAVGLLLIGDAQARCDFIPWQLESGFGAKGLGTRIVADPNTVWIALGARFNSALVPARVPVASVSLFETSIFAPPLSGSVSGDYVLFLFLTDQASHGTAVLRFTGIISGFWDQIRGRVTIENQFVGSTTQTVTLGRNLYTVNLDPFPVAEASLVPLDGGFAAQFNNMTAFVDVHPPAHSTPEPSCLALAGIGLGCLAVAGTLRHRCSRGWRWMNWGRRAETGGRVTKC